MCEKLSLPPAGWKYDVNCEVSDSLCSVFSPRLFTNVASGAFYASFFVSNASILSYTHFLIAKWNSEAVYLICKSHFFFTIVRFLQKYLSPLQDADNMKNLWLLYLSKGKYCVTEPLFGRLSAHSSYPCQPQELTMHFDGQRLGGVVWRSHIFSVRHTAVGPVVEPSCIGDRQDQTISSLLDSQPRTVTPRILPRSRGNWMPGLHVLVRGKKETKWRNFH